MIKLIEDCGGILIGMILILLSWIPGWQTVCILGGLTFIIGWFFLKILIYFGTKEKDSE